MRFATAAVALFAGVALAHNQHPQPEEPVSTAFETEYFTITSCGPEVENCPGNNKPVATDVPVPVDTTSAVAPVMTTPAAVVPPQMSASAPVPTLIPVVTSSVFPNAAGAESCGAASIETISTYYTTVIPTVSYITHAAEPCETSPPVESVPGQPPVSVSPPTNGTVPTTTPLPTGGAASMGVSGLLAVVAGAVALFA